MNSTVNSKWISTSLMGLSLCAALCRVHTRGLSAEPLRVGARCDPSCSFWPDTNASASAVQLGSLRWNYWSIFQTCI